MHLLFWTSVSTVGLSERCLNLGDFTCSLMAICYVYVQRTCPRVLSFGIWNQSEMNKYILKLCTSYFGRPSRPSVCLRGVWTLGDFTCSLTAICYVLCRELVLKPIWNESIYIEAGHLLFWTSVSTVGLKRGLNLGDFTCSLTAIYVLCRELVLGFWGSEPANLKWSNIYFVTYFGRPSRP